MSRPKRPPAACKWCGADCPPKRKTCSDACPSKPAPRPRSVHLDVGGGEVACGSEAAVKVATTDVNAYTCTRCGTRMLARPQLVNYVAAKRGTKAADIPIVQRRSMRERVRRRVA